MNVFDNLIGYELLTELREKYCRNFKLGWKSNRSNPYDEGHYNNPILPLHQSIPFDHLEMPWVIDENQQIVYIVGMIEEMLQQDYSLARAYVNRYTYEYPGYTHRDITGHKDCITAIIYLNREWHMDHFGATLLYDEFGEIVKAVVPKAGRIFTFPSEMIHSSSITSVFAPPKDVLVLNLFPRTKEDEFGLKFLVEYTSNLSHKGGNHTLLGHLYNTFKTVESYGVSNDAARAALWHSIYGTEYYTKIKDKLLVSRDFVRSKIGDLAEELVYTFCTMEQRTRTIIDGDNYELKMIELANLADQPRNFNSQSAIDILAKQLQDKYKK